MSKHEKLGATACEGPKSFETNTHSPVGQPTPESSLGTGLGCQILEGLLSRTEGATGHSGVGYRVGVLDVAGLSRDRVRLR